jgi:undecaprenyl-diphosphatase
MELSIVQAVVFGLIQGLGEFLPISSTAHLILLPYFLHWPDPGLEFDVALHLGTLVAVLAFFWQDWLKIFTSAYVSFKKEGVKSFKNELLYLLVIATIPGAMFGLLFEDKAETIFRTPLLIAITLIIGGAVLYWAEKTAKQQKNISSITLKETLIIGLSQALAVIPGFSRSGVTITAGLFSGLDKMSAARFSFLLSTPIIFGAAALKLPKLFQTSLDQAMVLGILSSAIFGFLAIKYLLKFLEKFGYGVFFWYRLVLGVVIILLTLFR